MKEALIAQFRELLQTEDIATTKAEVRALRSAYNEETRKERQAQFDAWTSAESETEGDSPQFEFTPNPVDLDFEELNIQFKSRMQAHDEKVKAEQKARLEVKKNLLVSMNDLIQNEENIGAAFARFNEIKDKWKEVPSVPSDAGREAQDEFYRLQDAFFYNIRIYKALQENDLQINERKKQVLIDKAKELEAVTDIRQLDQLVRDYQKEWMDVGPSPRETYQEMGDTFFGLCRDAITRIRAHYDSIQADREANVTAKEVLIEKMRQLNELDITNHSTWTKKTQSVLELQKEWKTVGPAPREVNEALWTKFRGMCDDFFTRKQAYYDGRREEQDANKTRKTELVEKAKELQESDDWRGTTDALIALQKEWKAVGPAPQRDEQKLWQKFRAACDTFFNRKKEHFAGQETEQVTNLEEKKKLIEEIKSTELTGDRSKDVAALKDFSARFNAIGFVPRKNVKEIYDAYNAALDEKYKKLNLDAAEKSMMSYRQRIEGLKGSSNAGNDLRRERNLLRDKIDRLRNTIRQYENNLEFFKGDGAAAMRKDYEKKIHNAEREIKEIREKLKLIDA